MDDVVALAWGAEESLLTPSVRRNSHLLAQLLAPEFFEIGQSGRRWTRDEVIAALVSEPEVSSDEVLTEREAVLISDDTVLLSYMLHTRSQLSRRSALWRREGSAVVCSFHQGTAVA